MSQLTQRHLEDCARKARENMEHWIEDNSITLEQEARAAARWMGKNEEEWHEFIPLLEAIEEGRLRACKIDALKPENIAGFNNYMANRN